MLHHNVLDISMYQVKLFLDLAEERNFSRVAEISSISQPTLSKRISKLEQTLGMRLFIREKRPVGLTPEAEALYNGWKELYFLFETAIEKADRQRTAGAEQLTVAAVDSGNDFISLSSIIGLILQEYPYLALNTQYLSLSVWRSKMIRGEIDIMQTSLFETGRLHDSMDWELLMSIPKGICVLQGSPYAGRRAVDLGELAGNSFVMISPMESPEYSSYVRKICLEHGFEPSVARYTPNAHNLINCLQRENEVLVCDRFLRGIDSPFLRFIPLRGIDSGLVAIWKKDNDNPFIKPVVEILKQHYKEKSGRYF